METAKDGAVLPGGEFEVDQSFEGVGGGKVPEGGVAEDVVELKGGGGEAEFFELVGQGVHDSLLAARMKAS